LGSLENKVENNLMDSWHFLHVSTQSAKAHGHEVVYYSQQNVITTRGGAQAAKRLSAVFSTLPIAFSVQHEFHADILRFFTGPVMPGELDWAIAAGSRVSPEATQIAETYPAC
jgi:hypothetical protein